MSESARCKCLLRCTEVQALQMQFGLKKACQQRGANGSDQLCPGLRIVPEYLIVWHLSDSDAYRPARRS
jgi:hypothetical protein